MKKQDNLTKNYKSISQHEAALLNAAEAFTVFSLAIAAKRTGWNNVLVKNTLYSLKKKGIIISLKKDNYVAAEKISGSLFEIATTITAPSYISYWTAAAYYGFTEQQPQAIQVVSTKRFPHLIIKKSAIETTRVLSKKFYGYQKMQNFAIAEIEKLIIEIVSASQKCGGIEEVKKILKNCWEKADQKQLLAYCMQWHNKAVFARVGYLLDAVHLTNEHERIFLKNIPSCFSVLNPAVALESKNIIYNKKWRIIVNDQ
ncbi:hypothetical protein HZA96_01205 [Candidatus Woesearchaeota archaeon]|nr:hypothetical protein [Candidatus Woesearchaeota archaeon]